MIVNAKFDQLQPSCEALGDHNHRLCPCRRRVVTEFEKDMNARVSKVVIRQLRELEIKIKKGAANVQSKSVHGDMNEFWAAHSPAGLIDDIKTQRNTFIEAPRGSTCFDACMSADLACQRHWFDVLNKWVFHLLPLPL